MSVHLLTNKGLTTFLRECKAKGYRVTKDIEA